MIQNSTLIPSAINITVVLSDIITVSHELCLAYLQPTQILYEEKVFLCKRDTDTKGKANISVSACNVFHWRQIQYYSSVLCSLLSLTVFTFLSLVCPIFFFNFHFFYFLTVHLSRGPSCLSFFVPSCFLPCFLPSFLSDTPLSL